MKKPTLTPDQATIKLLEKLLASPRITERAKKAHKESLDYLLECERKKEEEEKEKAEGDYHQRMQEEDQACSYEDMCSEMGYC